MGAHEPKKSTHGANKAHIHMGQYLTLDCTYGPNWAMSPHWRMWAYVCGPWATTDAVIDPEWSKRCLDKTLATVADGVSYALRGLLHNDAETIFMNELV
jgi:hypothetical protein